MLSKTNTARVPVYRIEVDRLPERFYEHARDWSELAITRILAEPLFIEMPDRTLRSTLIASLKRLDANAWRLELHPEACWSTGEALKSRDIARQILRARRAAAAGLVPSLVISSMVIESHSSLRLHTKHSIAHLERVLANPALAPRSDHPDKTTGAYTLVKSRGMRLRLAAVNKSHTLELVQHSTNTVVDQFRAGLVHFSGPMTISPQEWAAFTRDREANIVPLDIIYSAIMPRTFAAKTIKILNENLDRQKICGVSNGFILPVTTLTSISTNASINCESRMPYHSEFRGHSSEIPLYFSNFTGNFEVATCLADELFNKFGIPTSPISHSYRASLASASVDDDCVRLILMTPPWPHPAAILAPFLHIRQPSPEFRVELLAAFAEECLTKATALAANAEDKLLTDDEHRILAIGRVLGGLRSRLGSAWCPPSGWIDYSSTISNFRDDAA